uniref:EGF-like domain-containing protein n=1 Tax=Panagrolaimus superbus TaxID=310955 RepID=A0A914XZG8_9BILA
MLSEAIPNYEMILKSNEELTNNIKIIRLAENESANISCRIFDAGFDPESLSFQKNGRPVTNAPSLGHTYQVKNYSYSDGPFNFYCSAKRKNGKVQTREMRVTGGLRRELYEHEVPCAVNKCYNDGMCVAQKEFSNKDIEFCICPINFHGNQCEKFSAAGGSRDIATTNTNYLYISMGVLFLFAVVFAALYGREKLKRAKTKKQLQKQDEENASLQAYEVCDGREDANYAEQKVSQTYVINEYDNVPADERRKLNPQRPIIRGINTRDSIGVTEEIARTGRLNPDYGPSVARPILSDSAPFYP